MSLLIFDKKPIIKKNNEDVIDISSASIRYVSDPYIEYVINVTNEMIGRPDLISQAAYGITSYWDLILKFNGISNPFSLCENDILLIPRLDTIQQQLYSEKNSNIINDVKEQFKYKDRISKADKKIYIYKNNRKELFKKLSEKTSNPSQEFLPTNMKEDDSEEFKFENGIIKF
jgi:hypothetical protein